MKLALKHTFLAWAHHEGATLCMATPGPRSRGGHSGITWVASARPEHPRSRGDHSGGSPAASPRVGLPALAWGPQRGPARARW